jgi:hypothetical protein
MLAPFQQRDKEVGQPSFLDRITQNSPAKQICARTVRYQYFIEEIAEFFSRTFRLPFQCHLTSSTLSVPNCKAAMPNRSRSNCLNTPPRRRFHSCVGHQQCFYVSYPTLSFLPQLKNWIHNLRRRLNALDNTFPQALLSSCRSRPYFERNTRPLCGRMACNASRTLRQVLFRGISRSLPFFVFSNLIRFRVSETWDHSRLNCSLFRIPVFRATSNSGMCFANFFLIAARSLISSSADRNRIRALFSARCSTSRAGLLLTLPSASAILNAFPNTFL